MGKKRTEVSKYQSPSTGEYCTCAQYVAEIMCTRMAQKENEGTRAYKFWNTEKWKKTYQHQVVLANRLIKKYSTKAIVRAVNSRELKSVYSLRYPKIESVIQKYQKIIEQEDSQSTIIEVKEDPKSRSGKSFGKVSKMQRLRGLDGKKEDK